MRKIHSANDMGRIRPGDAPMGVSTNEKAARERAERLADDIAPLVRDGLSLRAIATRMNEAETRTRRKQAWSAQSVKNLIDRLGGREKPSHAV